MKFHKTNVCVEGQPLNKAFTLIELLAVIVILAIIAVIAIPMILDIISDSKLESFKRSSELYLKAVELTVSNPKLDDIDLTTCDKVENGKLICGEKIYKVEVQGKHPDYMEIKLDPNGQIYFAMKSDGYCMIKTEDDKNVKYKKIVNNVSNNDKEIKDNMCTLDPHTTEACFEFDTSTGTIIKYYKNENNDSTKAACPKDVVIPKKIDGIEVKVIGKQAFYTLYLTSVEIPNTVETIGNYSFSNNSIKELVIPEGVKTIGNGSFLSGKIEKLSLPSTLTSIGTEAFRGNKLPEEKAYIYKRNSDGSIDYSTIIGYGGALKDIIIPKEKNGVKLTTVGPHAFYYQGLASVEIPNTVTMIEKYAFQNNSIKELKIPEGVNTIGTWAFYSNPLNSITIKNTSDKVTLGSQCFGTFDINQIKWEPVVE